MARGWHYAKVSLSSALRLSFFWHDVYFGIIVPFSLSFLFLFVCVFLVLSLELCRCLEKNQNAPRPSEHPPVREGETSKRLGGIEGCKYKTSSWHLVGFPYGGTIIGSTV